MAWMRTALKGASSRSALTGAPSYGMIPPLGSVQSSTGLLISQATAMGVSTVFACVNRLATDLARCTPRLYKVDADGTKTYITDHWLLGLFKKPNDQQTWFEFAWQLWVGFLLRQNAYAAIKRNRNGQPYALIAINPDAVFVMEGSAGGIFYNVNRIGLWQLAMLAEFDTSLTEYDMFHLRGLTFNSLVGVSTIGLARDAIGLAMGLEQQASRWMKNGAQPSTWLKTARQLSEEAVKRLKAQFDNLHAGVQNTGSSVVLEEGLEPVKMSLDAASLDFTAQRNDQVLEICRFFSMPPHKIGVVDRGSVQNIAQQDQDYVNSAIMRNVELMEQKIEMVFGLTEEGICCELDHGRLLRADIITRRTAARLGITSAVTTPNEERKAEGLKPKPGGDDLLAPANAAALGSEMSGQAPDEAGRPGPGESSNPVKGTGTMKPLKAPKTSAATDEAPPEN